MEEEDEGQMEEEGELELSELEEGAEQVDQGSQKR